MRIGATFVLILLSSASLLGPLHAQTNESVPRSPEAAARVGLAQACAHRPNALGVARMVEIDTAGGPAFGFQHFKAHDFLRAGEIVLTFDDGPWPSSTKAVLQALAAHCVKATFFAIGNHALWHPELLKQVALHGHTVGTHTWSHANLVKKSAAEGRDEIEKGLSAVRLAVGAAPAPFFRFPTLAHSPEMISYLGERNIAIFSTDVDSFDFRMRKPAALIASVMEKLSKHGKGILLMHDFQRVTAEALPELLDRLAGAGYRVVHMRPKSFVQTLPAYDAQVANEHKQPGANDAPTASVVRTIGE